MSIWSLVVKALSLRDEVFGTLRERSDVFYRGFLVLVLAGLVSGLFESGGELLARALRPPNQGLVTQQAIQGFEGSYNGPAELRPMIESYVTEGVAMVFDLANLPPRSGAAFQPLARLLTWLGQAASVPLAAGFLGLLMGGGLLVHLSSRWLGGRGGIAQMLGLAALAFAPHLLDPISSLLRLAGSLTGSSLFGPLESLIGFVVFVWSAAIYVKATAVAQAFSYGRAVGAILIAVLIGVLFLVVVAGLVGALVAGSIATLIATTQ